MDTLSWIVVKLLPHGGWFPTSGSGSVGLFGRYRWNGVFSVQDTVHRLVIGVKIIISVNFR